MNYVPLIAVVFFFAGAFYLAWRTSRPRQSAFDAIKKYVNALGLRVEKISDGRNHWHYWLRGHLRLSNIARTYVIHATSPYCAHEQIHVAIDPLSPGVLKVLQKKEERHPLQER